MFYFLLKLKLSLLIAIKEYFNDSCNYYTIKTNINTAYNYNIESFKYDELSYDQLS